jgi:hypothetical protein
MIQRWLLTVFCPWVRIAELSAENVWLLEGWNRTCVLNDGLRDSLERACDRNNELIRAVLAEQKTNRELAEQLGALRDRAA